MDYDIEVLNELFQRSDDNYGETVDKINKIICLNLLNNEEKLQYNHFAGVRDNCINLIINCHLTSKNFINAGSTTFVVSFNNVDVLICHTPRCYERLIWEKGQFEELLNIMKNSLK